LQILISLLHRGACGCEANTGDGAGVLVQMPDRFLRKVTAPLGIALPPAGRYGSGLVFLPRVRDERERLRALIEQIASEEGQEVLRGRVPPTDISWLGASARASQPAIEQVFIASRLPAGADEDEAEAEARFERKLYVIRKRVEHAADRLPVVERHAFYIPSLS